MEKLWKEYGSHGFQNVGRLWKRYGINVEKHGIHIEKYGIHIENVEYI